MSLTVKPGVADCERRLDRFRRYDNGEHLVSGRRFHHHFHAEARKPAIVLIASGIATGDLPSRSDPEIAAFALLGAIFFCRLMTSTPFPEERVPDLIDMVMGSNGRSIEFNRKGFEFPPRRRRKPALFLTSAGKGVVLRVPSTHAQTTMGHAIAVAGKKSRVFPNFFCSLWNPSPVTQSRLDTRRGGRSGTANPIPNATVRVTSNCTAGSILMDWDHAIPLAGFTGGLLIGIAAAVMLLGLGRIAGVSGLAARAAGLSPSTTPWPLAAAFIVGLPLGAGLVALATGPVVTRFAPSVAIVALGGLVVGFGTRLGSGCTSGHGVCGLSRLSPRSIAATATFLVTGCATVAVMRALGVSW